MIPPGTPVDEARRLFALRRLQILDTKAEPAFDHITNLARKIFDVPIAFISFIDQDRQWFKSKQGLDIEETPRDISFCGYTILDDRLFLVNDASKDLRFCDNPLVIDTPHIQSYSGAPLHAPTGERIGALCIVDDRPRSFTEDELEPLRALAAIIEDMLCATDDLRRTAYYDSLTGLPNRVLINEKLRAAIAHADEMNFSVALLAINIDQFKTINQSLGHAAGDAVLKNAAQRIAECVGNKGFIGRTGVDEFYVVQPQLSEHVTIETLAKQILDRLAQPFTVAEHEIIITASAGACFFPDDSRSVDGLSACADLAVMEAKDSGRNIFCCYTGQIHSESRRRSQLHNDMRRALMRAEFELHYQPQIDIATNNIVGVEALLRWNHPELGLLTPGDFLDIAESSGLIIPIGEWVLQEACREAQKWHAAGAQTCVVAVNLSALQFKRDGLEYAVQQALHHSELPADHLEIELTESIFLGDNEQTQTRIQRLKALGIGVAIDDFGTGYSNLAYLQRFASDKLKIDQSFIRHMTRSAEDLAIIKAIINLADILQLKTIAEGVESEQQLELLRTLGCNGAQGYLFAKPLPAAAMQKLLLGEKNFNAEEIVSRFDQVPA